MESRLQHTGPAAPPGAGAFRADPSQGRLFTTARTVRSTDVTPAGRLRFDALARYLQQAAEDDLADARWAMPYTWLVRRVALRIHGFPAHRERVTLRTFCSGTGPRWAERTTTVASTPGRDGTGPDLIQATAVWVAITAADGRPVPLGDEFHQVYGASAQGHRVPARLCHPGPPGSSVARAWPLRAADFDTAGHVNNSIHWAAVEDVLAGLDWLPGYAELEYHHPILPGADPQLLTGEDGGDLYTWLCDGRRRLASARLTARPPSSTG
jgi:acyl-ACP thioesterase